MGRGRKSWGVIGQGRDPGTCTRLTRAMARDDEQAASGLDEVSTANDDAGSGKAKRRKYVRTLLEEVGKVVEKPQTRARTRTGAIATPELEPLTPGARGGGGRDIVRGRVQLSPQIDDGKWTKHQLKVLQEAHSIVKPAPKFWHLIAELVCGKTAEDCFDKFYSERTTTRAAQRLRPEPNPGPGSASLHNTALLISKPTADTAKEGVMHERDGKTRSRPNNESHGQLARATSRKRKREIEDCKTASAILLGQNGRKSRKRVGNFSNCGGAVEKHAGPERSSPQSSNELTAKCDSSRPLAGAEDHRDAPRPSVVAGAATGSLYDEEGWTRAQESALHDAYSTTRPAANFWHVISKRVPGKSAEDCFNKFYSAHPTPPRRSGAVPGAAPQKLCSKEVDSPLSDSNPQSLRPAESRGRGRGQARGRTVAATGCKRRVLQAHKTVRQILRKQREEDESYEADAFAALEHPDVVQGVIETEEDDEDGAGDDNRRGRRTDEAEIDCSAAADDVHLSDKENLKPTIADNNSMKDVGIPWHIRSPEILKKVEDLNVLDKYIDHLHDRHWRWRTRRKTRTNDAAASGQEMHPRGQDLNNSLNWGNATADVVRRAKQELRKVFSRSGAAVKTIFESADDCKDYYNQEDRDLDDDPDDDENGNDFDDDVDV